MRYIVSICAGLLVLILIMQVRIMGRLDDIAKGPIQRVVPNVSVSPSASAIAAEIRREMAKDEPPFFSFRHRGSGARDGHLTYAEFTMIRKAGPATDISIKAGAGIIARIGRVQSDQSDTESYELSFKPESGTLPVSWRFSISYADHDEKAQERSFDVTYYSDKVPPAHLQVTERHE